MKIRRVTKRRKIQFLPFEELRNFQVNENRKHKVKNAVSAFGKNKIFLH
jgi:hypothetical protein